MKQYRTLYEVEIMINSDNVASGKLKEDSIGIKAMGRFLASSDSYNHNTFVNSPDSFKIKPIDKSLLQDAKIYRFPKLALPRDKMELVNKKYNSRIIRDKEKADLAVVSDTFLQSLLSHSWNRISYVSKSDLENNLLDDKYLSHSEMTRLKQILLNVGDDAVFSTRRHYYYSQGNISKPLKDWVDTQSDRKTTTYSGGYTYYIPEEHCESYQWLFDNQDKLCRDNELGDIATEDSITLNEESYQSITTMITSDDNENKVMGLEMMANCNADTSHTFLALLFFFNSETMKYCKNWNYVNFKSLRSRFDRYIMGCNWGSAWPYDEVVKKLVEDDCLTEFSVQVIAKSMFVSVLERTFGVKESEGVFAIDPTVLVLKPEYKDKVIKKENLQLEDLPF